MMTWCTYTKSQMPYLNITVFWYCDNFLNLIQQILHVDFAEPINWLGLYLSYNWFMQSLKLVPAIFFYKQIFRRKVGLIYFLLLFGCSSANFGLLSTGQSSPTRFWPEVHWVPCYKVDFFQGSWCVSGRNCRKCSDYNSVSEAVPFEMT